ncbi:hypothetical protein ACROYT_G009583 [Oculina patagonica]
MDVGENLGTRPQTYSVSDFKIFTDALGTLVHISIRLHPDNINRHSGIEIQKHGRPTNTAVDHCGERPLAHAGQLRADILKESAAILNCSGYRWLALELWRKLTLETSHVERSRIF